MHKAVWAFYLKVYDTSVQLLLWPFSGFCMSPGLQGKWLAKVDWTYVETKHVIFNMLR